MSKLLQEVEKIKTTSLFITIVTKIINRFHIRIR
jgi:hypothetical protein